MAVTVAAPITRHFVPQLIVLLTAVVLAVALVVGFAIADHDSSPAVRDTGSGVPQELPSRFSEGR